LGLVLFFLLAGVLTKGWRTVRDEVKLAREWVEYVSETSQDNFSSVPAKPVDMEKDDPLARIFDEL